MNGDPFDAMHTFLINCLTDIEKFAQQDERYEEPRREGYHPKVLTEEQKQAIRKNLRGYSRSFEEADAAEEMTVSAELDVQRKRAVGEWNA